MRRLHRSVKKPMSADGIVHLSVRYLVSGFSDIGSTDLPDFQLEIPIAPNHLEVYAIGRNQPCAVRAGRQSDQNVEMQVAKFVRLETLVLLHFRKNPT